jgi:Spy/CpxP family protein refolding chaperone
VLTPINEANDAMVKRSAGAQLWLLAALTASSLHPGASLADSEPSSVNVADGAGKAARDPRRDSGTRLDHHIRVLSKGLDLDPMQESQLRSVLESQRVQLDKLWSDTTIPAEYRIIATRKISDQTADRIRALLSEEQRKKYGPHVEPHSTAPGAGEKTVEEWMNATKAKTSPAPAVP